MELEQKINSKPDKFSPESTLKIGNTKISLLKENSYMIESTGLLLDSINENITHSHEHSHEHSKGQKHDKRVNMSVVSDVPSKSKTTKKTKKSLYDKIKMKFNAESVMPLTTFINKQSNKKGTDYNVILHFIGNIGNQLTFLRNQGYSIPFFSLEDFIVIDNTIFSFMNDDKIFKIDDETKYITLDYPIQYNKNNSFIPPHIALGLDDEPDKIPTDIYFSSIYYSLAQLCVYIFLRKQIKDEEDYDKISGPFIYTSLYWCLKRCLDKDENKRILLYV
jgi:hypothetical protein